MKVLIFSITAGEGHNSTATAIQQCFEQHGDTAEVFDCSSHGCNKSRSSRLPGLRRKETGDWRK